MSAHQRHRHGVTRLEVVAALVCAGGVLNIAAVVGQSERKGLHPLTIRDATYQAQIHKGILTFSRQFNGLFPKPGMINRLAFNGVETPGLGSEDPTIDTTANLFSSCIAQNFFGPDLMISPIECNPKVTADEDYDYEAYNPINDSYWDATFAADLESGSNVSFAHMPLWGKRGRLQWRDTMDSEWPVFSDRGPRDGKLDPKSYTTNPHGQWAGVVLYNDGHWEFHDTVTPAKLTFLNEQGEQVSDNLFAADTELGGYDRLLTFTKSIDAETGIGVVQFD